MFRRQKRSTGYISDEIPYIPADVPYSHKNYYLAQELMHGLYKIPQQRPWTHNQQDWERINNHFTNYVESFENPTGLKDWHFVESFFKRVIEESEKPKKSDDKQKQNSDQQNGDEESENQPSSDLGKIAELIEDLNQEESDEDNEKSTAEILKLPENIDLPFYSKESRRFDESENSVLKVFQQIDPEKARKYVNIIEAAITDAMTREGRSVEDDNEHKSFDSRIANIKEYGRINEKSYLIPELTTLGLYRTINNQTTTIKSVRQKPKKLFVVLDDSGSMRGSMKLSIVYLTLYKIRERVLNQGLEVDLRFFEHYLEDRSYDLVDELPYGHGRFTGGDTDIQGALEKMSKFSEEEFSNATTLIINDGQDPVDRDFVAKTRTIAMVLYERNENLKKVCERSGGKYYEIR